jgi:hypothetical protein
VCDGEGVGFTVVAVVLAQAVPEMTAALLKK